MTPPATKQPSTKKLVSYAGTALMIAALVFLGRRLFALRGDIDVATLTSAGVIAGLVFVALFEGFGILLASFNFRALVRNVSGVLVAKPLGLVVYTISNLYKYIPGGVMYVVGRNRLAVETDDLSHPEVALSTVIEGALVAIAAVVIVIITAFDHARVYLGQVELPTALAVALIALVIIGASALYSFRQKISAGATKLFRDMQVLKPLVLVKRFGFALILMTLWGGTFLATLMVLGQEMAPGMAPTVIGLFLLAWLAGFLTPGAPSGLGVREMIMLMFMGGVVNEGVLISAMIIHRILAAAGDVAAYGVAVGYAHICDLMILKKAAY